MAANHDANAGRFHTVSATDRMDSKVYSFTIPRRYSNLKFINAGSQGAVVSADDSSTGTKVAIKKMNYPFIQPATAQRAFREFVLLSSVNHPAIIPIFSVFTPQADVSSFKDMYMDLKPCNIAVNENYVLKVLDFGLARLFNPSVAEKMTSYVVTRYYRAPEIDLKLKYTEKVDVWSIGCIFAEIVTGDVLFPGRHDQQINTIFQIMGTPSADFISKLDRRTAKAVSFLPRAPQRTLKDIIPDIKFHSNPDDKYEHWTASDARRLMSKMLTIDPDLCTIADALRDPYVNCWHQEQLENAPLTSPGYDRSLDANKLPLSEWKSLIFDGVKKMESGKNIFGGM